MKLRQGASRLLVETQQSSGGAEQYGDLRSPGALICIYQEDSELLC
jgi:hypothetical protein